MSLPAILEALARASLQGALFVAVVWIVCRLFPRLPAAVRCGLWWAACLKMLLGLVALPAVRVPVLPAAEVVKSEALYIRNVPAPRTLTPGPSPYPSLPPSQGEGKARSIDWRGLGTVGLVGIWLAGLVGLGFKGLRQLRYTRGVIGRAEPVGEGWVRSAFAEICGRLGLRRSPGLRGSGEVRTPLVTGLRRPVVLIPRSGLEGMSRDEISMTLCHELVHLRRRDLWLGWVPALAQRIFFFHPLAALAAREYAIAREAACDAEVLRVLGTAPQAYGRLLLRWGVAPRETGLAAAGASPSLQNLKRRLQMLQHSSDDKRRFSGWWWLAGAAILIGLAPLQIVAQEPAPAPEALAAPEVAGTPAAPEVAATPEPAEAAEAPEAVPAPAPTPAVAPVPPVPRTPKAVKGGVKGGIPGGIKGGVKGGVRGGIPGGIAGALAPAPPAPAATPLSALAPRAAEQPLPTPRPAVAPRALPSAGTPQPAIAPTPMAHPVARIAGMAAPPAPPAPPRPPKPPAPPKPYGYSYRTGGSGDSWVLLYGDNSVSMSGSGEDLSAVKRLRGSSKDDIFWFHHGGKAYVVRDPATVKRAKDLFEPQAKLGAKQGELGARQGKLGGQQGALGAKQGALGAQLGAIAADRARRGDEADARDLDKREKDIQSQMDDLSRQQEELGHQQEELGRQQEELGRQQEELGRKAEKELGSIMDQAIRSGVAQEVR